jgi:dipeptidyl aminopeptidase/acylaminoacyl peptidase
MTLSPNGKSLLFVADGQVRRVSVYPAPPTPPLMNEVPPYFATLGVNSAPQWSPDGKKIAFVSSRYDQRQLFPTQGGQVTHSFITLYDVDTKKIRYLTQSVDRDSNPQWSEDGKSISFVRRPGLAFGHFATTPTTSVTREQVPAGLLEGRLENGAAVALMTVDVATGKETESWHSNNPAALPNGTRIGDYFISTQNQNTWTRYFSTGIAAPDVVKPTVQLTPEGDGQVERVAYSPDGRFMYFVSSVGDLDHRHLWRVPVAGGQPEQLTKGDMNEIAIAIPGSGGTIAVLQSGFKQPVSVVVMNPMAQQARVIAPQVTPAMQVAKNVVPKSVAITAADGLVSRAIVFTPPDMRPGEKRPALVYAHGNGGRLLLGYPDQGDNAYYQLNYALINYFVNKGYIVAAINYRADCTCYSEKFNVQGPQYGANGVEEYRDVIATGLYLKNRPDVDAERLGIWGLSYGGWLTGEALSRNSDVFKAGAILAGVQLRSTSFDPTNLAFQSSPMYNLDKWTSPTLFIHGDDDRNVEFSQAVGAIQALRAKGTPNKAVVLPDETHYYLKWENLVKGSQAVDAWFDQMLIRKASPSGK